MAEFPSEAVPLPFPNRPADRLRLAMRRLDQAFEEQQRAVAVWRAHLADLTHVNRSLGASLTAYRGGLDDMARAVREVGEEARTLEGTAEAALRNADRR